MKESEIARRQCKEFKRLNIQQLYALQSGLEARYQAACACKQWDLHTSLGQMLWRVFEAIEMAKQE